MGMVSLRVRQGDPTEKVAHPTIFRRLENEMPVIRHQLVTQDAAGIPFEPLGKDSFKRFKVRIFEEDIVASVPAIQGVIYPTGLVGAFWSRHPTMITQANRSMTPDSFDSFTVDLWVMTSPTG